MAEEKSKKDDTYWKVLNCALELEFKKGHLKWTMTELSRKSHVTRSLIYYYFGRSKMDILQAAVSIIGEEFVGLGNERMEHWLKGEYEASLQKARRFYDKTPHLCAFYLNYRTKPNDIGDALLKVEKSFLRKLKKFAPKASQEQVNAMFAVYFGMGFSPHVGDKEVAIFSRFISDIFGKLR